MPSWKIHTKYNSKFGLSQEICYKIDEIIDDDEKSKEFFGDYAHHDFGRRNEDEFVLGVIKIYEHYGTEGLKCFLLHHVLDYIVALVKDGYDKKKILQKCCEKFNKLARPKNSYIEKLEILEQHAGGSISPSDKILATIGEIQITKKNIQLVIRELKNLYRKYKKIYNIVENSLKEVLKFAESNIDDIIRDAIGNMKPQKLCNMIFKRLFGVIQHFCWRFLLETIPITKRRKVTQVPSELLAECSSIVGKSFRKWLCEHESILDTALLKDVDRYVESFKERKFAEMKKILKENKTLEMIISVLVAIAKKTSENIGKTFNDA